MKAIGVRESNINTVRSIIETYADNNLEQEINISDFCYYLTSGGILIFLEEHILDGEEISRFISGENQCSSIFLNVDNAELWSYVAYSNGVEVDRFHPRPKCCDDEKYKFSGNANNIETYFNIDRNLVYNYFKFYNNEIWDKGEKAYESDISEYGDYMQVFDFMHKLGFEYIEEIDSLEMKLKWLGKIAFYENFTLVWDSSNKGGMRTVYRTRLEEIIDACLSNKTLEQDMLTFGWLYIYFKDEYVEFSRNYQFITLTYKEFYDMIRKYVDIYLNMYWTSNIEKTKLITALEKIKEISNKRQKTQPLMDENYNIIFKATLLENVIYNATLDQIMKEIERLNCYNNSFIHIEPSLRINDSLFLMISIRETGGIKYYDIETEIEVGKTIKAYKLETMEIEYVKNMVYYYVINNLILTSEDWKDESHKVCINEIQFTLMTDKEYTDFEIEDIFKAIDELTIENESTVGLKPDKPINNSKSIYVNASEYGNREYTIELLLEIDGVETFCRCRYDGVDVVKDIFVKYYEEFKYPDVSYWSKTAMSLVTIKDEEEEFKINRDILVYMNKGTVYLPLNKRRLDDVKRLKVLKCIRDKNNYLEKEISDISDLKYFEKLKTLVIPNNKIMDFTPIRNLEYLNKLDIKNGILQKLNFFKNEQGVSPLVISLKTLDISNNPIIDFEQIKYCTNLRYLNLDSTGFKDLSLLKDMRLLKELSISGNNNLENIETLEKLESLEKLTIEKDEINEEYIKSNLKKIKKYTLK